MRLIDADALKEYLNTRIRPVHSELAKEFPEIRVYDLEKEYREIVKVWNQIIDAQETVQR